MFFTKKKKADPAQPPLHPEVQPTPGLVKSIFLAYGIVVLHLSLIAMVGLLVLVLSGVVNYFIWLLLGGLGLVYGGIWFFLKKMKDERQAIRQILRLPEFQGKTLEISLFGGAASFKVGHRREEAVDIKAVGTSARPLLDTPIRSRIDDLGELSRLYGEGMITREEFEQLKIELLPPLHKRA
ncbi:MAG: SHOCT domain-containing protein [Thermodesulfobacteriota bacterium]